MLKRVLLSFVVPLAFAGCAAPPVNPAASADHPANPNAAEAPIQPSSLTLAAAGTGESAPATSESMPGMQHMGHDMGSMKHDIGGMKDMQHGSGGMKSMDHDMPGMKHNAPSSQPATTQAAVLYTCKMHPEVVSDKPGECPKCGMKLVVKKEAKTTEHGEHE